MPVGVILDPTRLLSLRSWWTEYADRKNDEEDEHVADRYCNNGAHGAVCLSFAIF
jgi:hypothetical protein